MGKGSKNKRNGRKPHSHSKPPAAAKSSTASGGEPPNASSSDNLLQEHSNAEQLENALNNDELERSLAMLAVLDRGKRIEALKLNKDACDRHENSSLDHTQASIHARVAAQIEGRAVYQEPMKNAQESPKKAASLSSDSIEFACKQASSSSNVQVCEEVVKECERALSMLSFLPVQKSSEQGLKSVDKELNSILNKAKIGKNNVGIGEKKSGCTKDPISTQIKKADKKDNLEEKKRNANVKKTIRSETRKLFRKFWNSISVEEQREILTLRINDVKVYCDEFKGVLGAEDLLSALGYGEVNHTWNYWECCVCEQRHLNGDSLIHHLMQMHLKARSASLTAILPRKIDDPIVQMLENCSWKPVDAVEAVRIIENESKDPDDQNWPLSDDSERAKILERIHIMFQVLLLQDCIALSHFRMVMLTAEKMLENNTVLSPSQIRTHCLDQKPVCICFLGASQLDRILDLLRDLHSEACCFMEDEIDVNQEDEKVVFCGDTLRLSLDQRLCCGELTPSLYPKVATNGASATTFAVSGHEADVLSDGDDFVKWLFEGCTIEEELASWQRLKDDKDRKGMEIYLILKKEFVTLKNTCRRRFEYLIQVKAIRAIRAICAEERKRREQGASYMPQSFVSLLKKRQKELVERGGDSGRAELYVISKVLEDEVAPAASIDEARAANIDEDGEHLGDNSITAEIREQWKESSEEVFKIDARIMWSINSIRRLNLQLAQVSVHDYQLIIVPLLKSFLQVQLQDLFCEALLEKLESDTSKNFCEGCNQMKHMQGKLKDKKRKKKIKMLRIPRREFYAFIALQATDGKPKHMLEEKDAEQARFTVPYSRHLSESQIAVSSSAAQLKQQEVELGRKIELEAEERLLEKNSERQRQIEDEAKRKQLAKQNKKADARTTPVVAERLLSATQMPTYFPGVPVDKSEGTKESSPVSGKRPEWKLRFSHGKVKQGEQPFRN
ncbi:unnamed protein product [Ilex paraguariensis]|uniref:C2H2-type domain-containing protein n=1 Tax=Ilex paraguariensis TaxID=185542 RepID=A0ABC8TKQ5_9AQUA